jgi:GDPmannose 4,6-dehydratase
MPTALITGITGQTGGYLCDRLLAEGWSVHGIVRDRDELEPEFHERSPLAELHTGDLASGDGMRAIVASVEPNAVFNLGGLSSVAQSWRQPELTGLITGLGVASLLDASWALREKTGRRVSFVQASSAEIFGHAVEVPQNESTAIRPTNPYGAAKAYAHHLVGVYRGLGLEASSCILYNHESPRRPDTFVTRKITRGVARIAAGLDTHLTLGNLDAIRDWGWAPDYAAAIALAASGTPGDYIIATGEPRTVRDFVAAAFAAVDITDWEPYILQDPAFMRPSDAPALVGDSSRARTELGWSPSVDFAELVSRMVENDRALLGSGDSLT